MRFTTELVAIELSPRRFLSETTTSAIGRKTTFINDRKFSARSPRLLVYPDQLLVQLPPLRRQPQEGVVDHPDGADAKAAEGVEGEGQSEDLPEGVRAVHGADELKWDICEIKWRRGEKTQMVVFTGSKSTWETSKFAGSGIVRGSGEDVRAVPLAIVVAFAAAKLLLLLL